MARASYYVRGIRGILWASKEMFMKSQSIIWAIDPYETNKKIWERSKDLAVSASKSLKYTLQPLYVADRSSLPPIKAFDAKVIKKFIHESEKKLSKLVKPIPIRRISQPRVLFSQETGSDAEAQILDEFACEKGTPLVIATTNARKKLDRFLQGSFAETLVQNSHNPVILANPKCRDLKKIRHIVFATDFSPLSKQAMIKVCETARAANASLEIISVLMNPFFGVDSEVSLLSPNSTSVGKAFLEVERKRAALHGAKLIKLAKKHGVSAVFTLEETSLASMPRALLKSAYKKNADIFAMAARGDTSKVHFFGSTSQDVIRHSHIPVWIYHPKANRSHTSLKSERNLKKRR